jgi:uncharacterized protein (UPF0261 family)
MNQVFLQKFRQVIDSQIEIQEVDHHINDKAFGQIAATVMHNMIRGPSAEGMGQSA